MTLLHRLLIALLAVAIAAGSVHAQPAPPAPVPAPAPIATVSFLEQRVIEELAADGIVLSRLGVVLAIALVDRTAVLSLVDTKTNRAVASTKLDQLPGDRDTAVATITPAVANLVSQIATRGPDDHAAELERLRAIEATQRELLASSERARVEAEQRAIAGREERERVAEAEQAYAAQAIGFGADVDVWIGKDFAAVNRHWTAHRGDTQVPLRGADFYRAVDRPDLAATYRRRQIGGGVALILGAGAIAGGVALALQTDDADEHPYQLEGMILGGAGFLGAGLGYLLLSHPHPVGERTARELGAAHNRKLREQLGLPVPPAPTALRDVRVTPYLSARGGGLGLSATF